jgi:peptidoglycan/LPS O-acetylase OafA/YrhL
MRTYRPEIDGLRTIAVIPVILYHAGLGLVPGGFVGVDVFFVISGYLISSILLDEIHEDRFSVLRFYERRARRLVPALAVVTIAAAALGWMWLLPEELATFGESLVAVNLFVSNILFWARLDYFAADADLQPMLHTWSLAVEEQFYLIFPLLLLALRRLSMARLGALTAAWCLASFALAEWGSHARPGMAFFLLPFRAWELGVGALLAIFAPQIARIAPRPGAAIAAMGLLAVLGAICLIDGQDPFPGVYALPPVLGTAAIIACAGPGNLVGRLLSLRPMVGIGLISYSAYLWHQPLFALGRIRWMDAPPAWLLPALGALSLVLAWATWRYVERPFRISVAKGGLPRSAIFTGAGVVGAAFIALGAGLTLSGGAPGRFGPEVARIMAARADVSPWRDSCLLRGSDAGLRPGCVLNKGEGRPVWVWADSHGVEIAWKLSELLQTEGRPVRQITRIACPPLVGASRSGAPDACSRHNDAVAAAIAAAAQGPDGPTDVVLIGRWPLALEGARFDNGEGGIEHGGPGDIRPLGLGGDDAARRAGLTRLLQRQVKMLDDEGVRTVLVHAIPETGWSAPERLARQVTLGRGDGLALSTSLAVQQARARGGEAMLDAVPRARHVRPARLFCDLTAGRCPLARDGRPLYFDDDHPSGHGAAIIAARIVETLNTWTILASER